MRSCMCPFSRSQPLIASIIVALGLLTSIGVTKGQELSANKQLIHFSGLLVDDSGAPVSDASIQFWQTDANGIYNHPGSIARRGNGILDPSFQYFGTAQTGPYGNFFFQTIKPGIYPGRPSHIHFKVWIENNTKDILTSQFYFEGENGGNPSSLTLNLTDAAENNDANQTMAFITNKTIAIDMGGGGTFPLTPAQTAGPFYPVIDFFDYDNDITSMSYQNTVVNEPTSVRNGTVLEGQANDTSPQQNESGIFNRLGG